MPTSSVNFSPAYKNAELKDAAGALESWLRSRPDIAYFTFDEVCRDLLSMVPADQLNRVILRLVAAGELQERYRVKFRNGEYTEEDFDSWEKVPACVFDSAFEPVIVEDGAKVPSYSLVR